MIFSIKFKRSPILSLVRSGKLELEPVDEGTVESFVSDVPTPELSFPPEESVSYEVESFVSDVPAPELSFPPEEPVLYELGAE